MKALISILAVVVLTIVTFTAFELGKEAYRKDAREFWYQYGWDEGYKLGKQRGEERAIRELQITRVNNRYVGVRIGYYGEEHVYSYGN